MTGRLLLTLLCAGAFTIVGIETAQAQQAYGRAWGRTYNSRDWERFYHYPYVYYPQNFWGQEYYRSNEHPYHRYPPEMRIPVYNQQWFNYYPTHRGFYNGRDHHRQPGVKYHSGHHFVLDVM